jgi:hypothetical protein
MVEPEGLAVPYQIAFYLMTGGGRVFGTHRRGMGRVCGFDPLECPHARTRGSGHQELPRDHGPRRSVRRIEGDVVDLAINELVQEYRAPHGPRPFALLQHTPSTSKPISSMHSRRSRRSSSILSLRHAEQRYHSRLSVVQSGTGSSRCLSLHLK